MKTEFGMAQNLEEKQCSIVIFGSDENIGEGQTVKRTGKVVSVPVGEAMIGRVVNALGQPIDGAGRLTPKNSGQWRARHLGSVREDLYISLFRPVSKPSTL